MKSVLRHCQQLTGAEPARSRCFQGVRSVRQVTKESCTCSRFFQGAKPAERHFASACGAEDEPEYYPATTSKEEWLKVDEKVNTYPSFRTFKAIGSADDNSEEFVNHMVQAVEEAGNQAVLIKDQVRQRPSKNGKYLSVSVHKVNVESGEQVYGIYEAIRSQCGDRLKFII